MSSSSDSTVTTRHDDCNNADDPFSQSDLTQTISDSQFNDDDMYRIIQSKFGQLDRTNFKRELLQNTEAEDLKPIRNSLFELTRQNGDCLLRESRLVERTNREHGASIEVKLSDDIYMLFHYLEGTYTIADLKPLLSRSRRNTNTQNDNEDSNIHDVVNKLSNKGINPSNSFVLATILELKQSFNENIQSIGDKLETLSKKFEDENKMLKQEIMSKESEITQLNAALQEEKHANGRLRADIKLKSQDLKVQEEKVRATEEQRQNVLTRIINRLESIDGKWKTFSNKPRSYSDSVKYSANEWPAKLPTQENGNDTRNLPILSKDTEQSVQIVNTIPYDMRSTDNNFARYNQNFETEKKRPDHELRSREQIHKIETHVTNDNTDLFCGVFRQRTKRIVLYNVKADRPFELVDAAIRQYAQNKGVHISYTKLMRKRDFKNYSTYTLRVNIHEHDFDTVETDQNFWPNGVYWRDYVPRSSY